MIGLQTISCNYYELEDGEVVYSYSTYPSFEMNCKFNTSEFYESLQVAIKEKKEFRYVVFVALDFSEIDFSGCDFEECAFIGCTFPDLKSCTSGDIRLCTFIRTDFPERMVAELSRLDGVDGNSVSLRAQ